MKKLLLLFFVLIATHVIVQNSEVLKNQVIAGVEYHAGNFSELSDAIWEFAEIAFLENQSAAILTDFTEQHGFTVTRGY